MHGRRSAPSAGSELTDRGDDQPDADAEHDQGRDSLKPRIDPLGSECRPCGVGDDAEDQHAEGVRQGNRDRQDQRLDLGSPGSHQIGADDGLAVTGSK